MTATEESFATEVIGRLLERTEVSCFSQVRKSTRFDAQLDRHEEHKDHEELK